MQFRLIYSGRLLGATNYKTRADHKAQIRAEFSPQLERLISTKPMLRRSLYREGFGWFRDHPEDRDQLSGLGEDDQRALMINFWTRLMSNKWKRGDQGFVPLLTDEMDIRCGVEILFLRPEEPGLIVNSGDLDNRLKSLLDALKVPDTSEGFEPT